MLRSLDLASAAPALVRDCLGAFPEARLRVTGHCLDPALVEGETVILVSPSRHRPRFGDLVLACLPQGLRLHRIVWGAPLPGRIRTQADRGRLWDAAIDPGAILGTVTGIASRPGDPVRSVRQALVSLCRGLLFRLRLSR